jgi:death-on-curing protein
MPVSGTKQSLSVEQVLFIHARLIAETGGSSGIRDLGLLQSAVARPLATFGGQELYPDLFAKAAALMESLIRNHPFIDGNKRVGITAAALLLIRNGRRLTATNREIEHFTLEVAQSQRNQAEIAAWLQAHSLPHTPP